MVLRTMNCRWPVGNCTNAGKQWSNKFQHLLCFFCATLFVCQRTQWTARERSPTIAAVLRLRCWRGRLCAGGLREAAAAMRDALTGQRDAVCGHFSHRHARFFWVAAGLPIEIVCFSCEARGRTELKISLFQKQVVNFVANWHDGLTMFFCSTQDFCKRRISRRRASQCAAEPAMVLEIEKHIWTNLQGTNCWTWPFSSEISIGEKGKRPWPGANSQHARKLSKKTTGRV